MNDPKRSLERTFTTGDNIDDNQSKISSPEKKLKPTTHLEVDVIDQNTGRLFSFT